MKEMGTAEIKQVKASLHAERGRTAEPLRDCVRTAVENYFEQLEGYRTSGLYEMVIGEVEAPLLETVMRHTRGNQSQAAEVLGINRGTLRKKLKTYHLT